MPIGEHAAARDLATPPVASGGKEIATAMSIRPACGGVADWPVAYSPFSDTIGSTFDARQAGM